MFRVLGERPRIAVLGIILFFAIANVYWMARYRLGGLLDIDETGFFVDALTDLHRQRTEGLAAGLASAFTPSNNAPGLRLLTSAALGVDGNSIPLSMLVPTVLAALLLGLVYLTAGRVLSQGSALAALALTATCPVFLDYSRSFGAAMPTALAVALAVFALLASERFTRLGWSTAFGAAIGLMLLSRVMTVALLPGLAAASLLWLLGDHGVEKRRFAGATTAIVAAMVVAGPWYATSWRLILNYLTSFGYGSVAQAYGDHGGFFGRVWANLNSFYLLPHVLALAFGAIGYLLSARQFNLRAFIASPLAAIAAFVVPSFIVVASSSNIGTGFLLPLLGPSMLLVADGLRRLAWKPLIGVSLGLAAVAAVPKLDLSSPLAVPFAIAGVSITDGRAPIQRFYGNLPHKDPRFPVSGPDQTRWQMLVRDIATTIHDLGPVRTAYATMAFANNINTLRLEYLLDYGTPLNATYLEPSDVLPSHYASWLMNAYGAGPVCALLVLSGSPHSTFSNVDTAAMNAAASSVGLRDLRVWGDPIGNTATLKTRGC